MRTKLSVSVRGIPLLLAAALLSCFILLLDGVVQSGILVATTANLLAAGTKSAENNNSGSMRGVENPAHSRSLYMIHCQGCHLPQGDGAVNRVPNMKHYLGNFLKISGGREFLIQVPGSANAPMNDYDLAQLINWMLNSFSPKLLADDWQPYTAEEVRQYRRDVLTEVVVNRQNLVDKINKL